MENRREITVRPATVQDLRTLVEMARCLAEYEKRPNDARVSEEGVRRWLFERKVARALIAEAGGEALGYALFYPVYQSFAGQGALHVEDVVVKPRHRGEGIGRRLMCEVAALALQEGYDGMDWTCLDWNEDAMKFYEGMGAERGHAMVGFGFEQEALRALAPKHQTPPKEGTHEQ